MNDQQKVSLPDIDVLFRETWALYKSRFRTLISISLVPTLVSFMGGLLIGGSGTSVAPSYAMIGLGVLLVALGVVLGILSYLATIYALRDTIKVFDAYRAALRRLFAYLWIVVLNGLMVLGGFIMGVIPGVIFSIWFIFAPFILVVEDKRGLDAILKSKELVRGEWWPVFGRIIILTVAILAITFLILLPIAFLGETAVNLGNVVLQIFLLPYVFAFGYILYRQFTALKPDLMGAPVAAKKGFFVFSAILGLLVPIILIATVGLTFVLNILKSGSQLNQDFNLPPTNSLEQSDNLSR